LYDNHWHHTHFTGFLLEEEIEVSFWDFVLKLKCAKCLIEWLIKVSTRLSNELF
jgi:hypothetical protein